MLQKLFSYVILVVFFLSSVGETVLAREVDIINSLDSLPYAEVNESTETRRALLDGDIPPHRDTVEVIHSDFIEAPSDMLTKNTVSFESPIESNDSLMTLLSEKRIFEKKQELVTPGFITDPFTHLFLSGSSIALISFLASGSSFSWEVWETESLVNTSLIQNTETDTPLPRQEGKKIELLSRVKQKSRVSTIRGDLTFEMSTGTAITAGSGETIDTSKIVFAPLDPSKKLKAKGQYEKKMKNRWTKKKGLTEAQVEGFEFGLSGSHLIFSKPVTLSMDTPNMSDGVTVDLMTMHEGDTDFHTWGLSVSPSTLCNSDGMASIPGSQAVVKNGKVTFYTCGASLFTMNPTGGTAGSNDLKVLIWDCAQIQIYYNNLAQIFGWNPPATGCGGPGSWAMLRIGGVTYGNNADGVTATAWSTQTTTGSTSGNTYTATSTMTRVVGTLTYTLIIDWSHTAPNKFFTWSYRVIIPATNTLNVRFYMGNDTTVAWWDPNDAGYFSNTGGTTVGIYDSVANVLSAFRYMSGAMWTGYEAWAWGNITTRINGGTDFNNTISTTADQGFWVNWNLGTLPGTYSGTVEWRLLPYVAANVVDLIPGIGSPEWPLTTNLLSQIPIVITNAGNLTSSWVNTVFLTIPTNINGPAAPFTDNGWSCGAQVGTWVTCTKTTNITTPLGTDTVRIPVIPTLAASGSSVTFTGTISNPWDSNITNNSAFATNAVVWGALATSPGWVWGATLWLRANTGTNCTTGGCTITTWSNSGTLGTAANALTSLGVVTYDLTNKLNYNPTLYFNNASLATNSTLNVTTAVVSVFSVTSIGWGGAFLIGTQSGTANALSWATSPTWDRMGLFAWANFYSGTSNRSSLTSAITTSTRSSTWVANDFTNNLPVLAGANATAFVWNTIGIGRTSTTNSTLANVGEVIIYPTELTGSSRNQVESYLAIKYGITLDQTIATNYTLSNGAVIWSAALAWVWKNNITGIARDDITTLTQNQSQSVTNPGDIIVSKAAIATNRMALTWANDGGSISTFTGVDAPTGYQRITREWLVQEKNGDLGTVTISYPAASVATGLTVPLFLLTDTDSTFATGSTAYTGTFNTGANTWDFSLNIADMQYITFAKSVSSDSTPPNITSISIASGTLIPTSNFPLTVSYADTGSTVNPSSFTGKIYLWDATGATWSLTNIAASYLSITSASTSTGILGLTGLPYGKYRFDISIADSVGNIQMQSYTYYVDAIEWTISSPSYSIGNAPLGSTTFGTGELLLTVKTVGAGFDLTTLRTTDLTYITDVIPVYSWSTGWWYDRDIWAGYSGSITPHDTTQTIISVAKNINPNGAKNTFVYRLKYGINPSANTPAGDYTWDVRLGINLIY
jgi:hypothetical protein